MFIRSFILISFLFAALHATAQKADTTFRLVRTFKGDIAGAAMDHLDNLYIISSTGQVKKFNAAGDSAGLFNGIRNFGPLYSIDVSNPLKILLFYKDFSTVVVLDRFLANVASINLRQSGVLQPGAVGLSYDNHYWVFDQYDSKLKKLDEQGQKVWETVDFRTVFTQQINPQKILSDNGLVYLADTSQGIFVFDNYGSFKKKIPLTGWNSVLVKNERIITTSAKGILLYDAVRFVQTEKKAPFFQPYLHSFSTSSMFIGYTTDSLQIYRFRF